MSLAIYVIGVCGAGKSVVGNGLSESLACEFIEGDQYHPAANIEKMSRGDALTDADRWPWLTALAEAAGSRALRDGTAVTACSGLKRAYRQLLREKTRADTVFIHLCGSKDLIRTRMQQRKDHFMPVTLIESQFATLEPPENEPDVHSIDVDRSIDDIVALAVKMLTSPS